MLWASDSWAVFEADGRRGGSVMLLSSEGRRALGRGAAAAFMVLALTSGAEARRAQAPSAKPPASPFAPAGSLEGNFLAAYIAGASRDTSAAAVFYREALREDPANPELL